MSESAAQQAVIQWFKYQYPDKIIFSIPNGAVLGGKNKFALMASMKRQGLLPGVSDLFIPEPQHCSRLTGLMASRTYHGLFLEMKALGMTKCKVSGVQQKFIEDMKQRGYRAEWAAGFEDARDIITDYFKGR